MPEILLETAPPRALGLCPRRWERVLSTARSLCGPRSVPALSLQVQRRGLTTGPLHFGTSSLQKDVPVDDSTQYLVASITKPIVAMATLLLVERGAVSLNDRVSDLLPKFRDAAKRPTTLRHLLSHTSGLPDMLPNNQELRQANAPLARFVDETCQAELVFPPGRGAQYQSMGFVLLDPVIQEAAGAPLRAFLQQDLFGPLGMQSSHLGLPSEEIPAGRIAEIAVPESQREGDGWNWNSPYWRQLGAPWGGVLSTASDLSRFCRAMLRDARPHDGDRIFSPAAVHLATTNRLHDFPLVPESDRRTRGWGLGWRMNWRDHRGTFGDLVPEGAYGHWGATGTLVWLDPQREVAVVLLSTRPLSDEVSPLVKLSNMIAAAFLDG